MFQIYWTEEAEQDLEFVLTYYLENASVQVVESVYARIKEQIENLNNLGYRLDFALLFNISLISIFLGRLWAVAKKLRLHPSGFAEP